MNEREKMILTLLQASSQGLYGMQMVEASGGVLQQHEISVYLSSLTVVDYITSELENPPPRLGVAKRRYTITDKGREALERN